MPGEPQVTVCLDCGKGVMPDSAYFCADCYADLCSSCVDGHECAKVGQQAGKEGSDAHAHGVEALP